VLGIGPDRFDHQVEFVGAIDFARHAVGLARHEVVGFGEVMQPINALGVAIDEQQHRARPVLLPREQEEMIGAEIKHGGEIWNGGLFDPRPVGSAVEGFTRRTPPVEGYRTERRLRRARPVPDGTGPDIQEAGGGGPF
jgi:hypothetical protein